VHFATFAMFAGAALHGITAGTDTGEGWARLLYVATGAATLALVLYRVQHRMPDTSVMRSARLGAGVVAVSVTVALLVATGLVARDDAGATQTTADGDGATAQHPFLATFDNDFNGRYTQTRGPSGSRLVIDGTSAGDLPSALHVELVETTVAPTPDDETVEPVPDDEDAESRPTTTVTTNRAELRDVAAGAVFCAGTLTSLDGGYLRATCDGSGPYDGVRISLASRMRTSPDGSLTGALSGSMRRLS
jgi:hypothetical protein